METIFMNSESSKTNESNRLKLSLADKRNPNDASKNMALPNFDINYTWKNIKSACSNSKCKISAATWNDKFDLPNEFKATLDLSSRNTKL